VDQVPASSGFNWIQGAQLRYVGNITCAVQVSSLGPPCVHVQWECLLPASSCVGKTWFCWGDFLQWVAAAGVTIHHIHQKPSRHRACPAQPRAAAWSVQATRHATLGATAKEETDGRPRFRVTYGDGTTVTGFLATAMLSFPGSAASFSLQLGVATHIFECSLRPFRCVSGCPNCCTQRRSRATHRGACCAIVPSVSLSHQLVRAPAVRWHFGHGRARTAADHRKREWVQSCIECAQCIATPRTCPPWNVRRVHGPHGARRSPTWPLAHPRSAAFSAYPTAASV